MAKEVFWVSFNRLSDGTHSNKFVLPEGVISESEKRDKFSPVMIRLEFDVRTGGVSATMEKCDS